MSILSFIDLSYSYNQKKTVFKGLNAELELGKIYAILGSSGCGKQHFSHCLADWTVQQKEKYFLMEKILLKKDLLITDVIMYLLSFSLII